MNTIDDKEPKADAVEDNKVLNSTTARDELIASICHSLQDDGIRKVLFVCTANFQRSKTCEDLFKDRLDTLAVKSAGVSERECQKRGTTLCTEEMLAAADVVFTFEQMHIDRINDHTNQRFNLKMINLNIEDRFQYMQKSLIEKVLSELNSENIRAKIRSVQNGP